MKAFKVTEDEINKIFTIWAKNYVDSGATFDPAGYADASYADSCTKSFIAILLDVKQGELNAIKQ